MPRRSYEPVGDAYRRAYDALHRRSDDADTLTAERHALITPLPPAMASRYRAQTASWRLAYDAHRRHLAALAELGLL